MKSILSRLAENWERTAMGIVCCACLCILLAWLLPRAAGGNTQTGTTMRQRPSALGPDACSFLGPNEQAKPSGDAFAFAFTPPPTPEPEPPQTTPKIPGDAKKDIKDGDGTKDVIPPGLKTHKGPGKEEIPPTPTSTRSIRYLGIYQSTDGQRLAALTLRDPANGRTQTRFLRPGQTCDGIRVDSFDTQSLRVLVPGGTRAKVERGGVRTVDMN